MTIEEFFKENNITFKPGKIGGSDREGLYVHISLEVNSGTYAPNPKEDPMNVKSMICLDALMDLQEIAEMRMDQIRFILSGKPPLTKLRLALNKLPFEILEFDDRVGKHKILRESHIETSDAMVACGDREPTDEEIADAYIRTQKRIIDNAQEDLDEIKKIMEDGN